MSLHKADGGVLVVRTVLGENHDASAYHGVLLDAEDLEPCGLIRLDIVA